MKLGPKLTRINEEWFIEIGLKRIPLITPQDVCGDWDGIVGLGLEILECDWRELAYIGQCLESHREDIELLLTAKSHWKSMYQGKPRFTAEEYARLLSMPFATEAERSRVQVLFNEDTARRQAVEPSALHAPRQGFIYLMMDRAHRYTKIGFSETPSFREKTLQAERPTIEMLGKWQGTTGDEKELHGMFQAKRIRGEWFDLDTADIAYIGERFSK